MSSLIAKLPDGTLEIQAVKVQPKNPTAPVYYMRPERSVFGEYMAPVPEIEVIRELATLQLQSLGSSPVWYEVATLPEEVTSEYKLAADMPVPDRASYIATTKLYRDFCTKYKSKLGIKTLTGCALEVGTKMFYKEGLIYFFIFKQEVSGGAVDWKADDKLMDVVTGEVHTEAELLIDGYKYCGLSHSHNTMQLPDPSNIDDKQEINMPGIYFLHSCFSNIDKPVSNYRQTVTVTTGNKRYWVTDYVDNLTALEWLTGPTYHPDVFSFITEKVYVVKHFKPGSNYYKPPTPGAIVPKDYYADELDFMDPQHWGWGYDDIPTIDVPMGDAASLLDKLKEFMEDNQVSATEVVDALGEL
jgi:hypothetical protein